VKHFPQEDIEIIQYWINHEQAQKSWAEEFKISYNPKNWFLEIIEAQIFREDPDVVYNTTLNIIPYDFIQRIKQKVKKKIFWISYYGVQKEGEFVQLKEYDLFVTGFRELEKELKTENKKYEFLPHYFDDQICKSSFNSKRSKAISFAGSLSLNFHDGNIFLYRRHVVEALMDLCDLETSSDLNNENNNPKEAIRQRICKIRYEIYQLFNSLPQPFRLLKLLRGLKEVTDWEVEVKADHFFNPRLMKQVLPPCFGSKLYKLLNDSKITLNVHGHVRANYGKAKFAVGNIRLFEATGSGCCLLTDHLPHLEEFFIPDEEVVTFRNKLEAVEKAKYLTDNPKAAESIAKKGYNRAWKYHSSEIRAKQFSQILKRYV
jgi:spore maturation protein CgeB